jgi:phage terminase Nu1 subunit (DNA packaging protein)
MAKRKKGKTDTGAPALADKRLTEEGLPVVGTAGEPDLAARDAKVLELLDKAIAIEAGMGQFHVDVEVCTDDLKGAKKRLEVEQERRRKLLDEAMALRAGRPYQAELDLDDENAVGEGGAKA